jgi:hypothetical protein
MNTTPIHYVDWDSLIPPEQWAVYRCLLDRASAEGVQFALGGGLAVGLYTGNPRNTKDLDIYIMPADRERVIRMMTDCGLTDYFHKKPYDRAWIYRGNQGETIVDAIWAMANKRTDVDDIWLTHGAVIKMFDQQIRVIPAEELIWSKLYVMQRERCDWPDIINLICAGGAHLNWGHLMSRVAEDLPLLRGVLSVVSWVSPERALAIPRRIWESIGLPIPRIERDPEGRPRRPDLLDSRPWLHQQLMQPAA